MSILLVRRESTLTRLKLNRSAKANALDAQLVEELFRAIEQALSDGTRLVVLESGGTNFSAGFDFSGVLECSEADLLWRFVRIEQLLQRLFHAPFPVLALASGRNFGAGVDLFAACEIRIAAPDCSFRMPGWRFGVQLGTRRLAQRITNDPARAVLKESRTIGGQEACELGLATSLADVGMWESIIEAAHARALLLSPEAAGRLRRATIADTRDADMADLVASIVLPGLKSRIAAYLKESRMSGRSATQQGSGSS